MHSSRWIDRMVLWLLSVILVRIERIINRARSLGWNVLVGKIAGRLAETLLAEQGVGPGDIVAFQRWVGLLGVVDIFDVSSFVDALIQDGLEIERDVVIALSERNGDRR